MPFSIVEGDITKLKVDAIVNAANKSLLGGGGVDGAIHRASGPKLLEECRTLNGCETGQAKITGGYDLAAKYVIHTVGPIWTGGRRGEPELLCAAYRNSLNLAKENNCESVAFPLISSGVYGYPKDQALKMAVRTIREFLEDNEMNVILVIFDKSSFRPDMLFMSEISEYIRNNMEQPSKKAGLLGDMARSIAFGGASGSRRSIFSCKKRSGPEKENSVPSEDACEEPKEARPEDVEAEQQDALYSTSADAAAYGAQLRNAVPDMSLESDLKKALDNLDESFSQALLRMIDARGMKDSECYKKANIDRKLFSKIRSDVNYRPSKQTVLAFAIALELDLYEAEAFLRKAGYALSRSNKADVIVEYFITNKNYDMYRINEALFAFDQNLLGA